ncbi:MAG: DUF2867 domain-containing protein [Pseudomonadota bacterium]
MIPDHYLKSIPDLAPLFAEADHVDVKTVDAAMDLRLFLTRFMTYHPWWIVQLYRARAVLVRALGMRQDSGPLPATTPESISFTPGDPWLFFTITCGRDGEYLAAHHADKHLRADLLVAREWMGEGVNRFHVGTIVHHAHWTGPVYFAIIRPFHHMVVRMTMRHAAGA